MSYPKNSGFTDPQVYVDPIVTEGKKQTRLVLSGVMAVAVLFTAVAGIVSNRDLAALIDHSGSNYIPRPIFSLNR